jgi:hypothetical protein
MRHVDTREKLTTLFQPDVLVSLQFYEAIKRRVEVSPERDLLLA